MIIDKVTFLQNFQMLLPQHYHQDSLKRLAFLQGKSLRKAAVLIGLVERDNGLHVIFTQRAAHLRYHPGQISFPGGKYELNDVNLMVTALRETEEEIGIHTSSIEVFGQLPSLPTVSRFSVTPFLAFVEPTYNPNIDPNEVASIFEIPLNHILNPQKMLSSYFQLKSTHHRVFAVQYQQHFIWGMTAQIIESMQRHILEGHLEKMA
ncbi:CoA pyrophosphatase [Vibrio azureus]|uniref:Putative hydrolase n=1 Tax=Vibrio azureus NBRC 104587 TaxID=1219077 RepID=U3C7E4_9VIBR|nr:CoA pyrophosphatase [Vibrio azureus]GAD74343.1 putative hydrolase [Vibrio azureus NBRC 104587]